MNQQDFNILKEIIIERAKGFNDGITDNDIKLAWEKAPSKEILVNKETYRPIKEALENIYDYDQSWCKEIENEIFKHWCESYKKMLTDNKNKQIDNSKNRLFHENTKIENNEQAKLDSYDDSKIPIPLENNIVEEKKLMSERMIVSKTKENGDSQEISSTSKHVSSNKKSDELKKESGKEIIATKTEEEIDSQGISSTLPNVIPDIESDKSNKKSEVEKDSKPIDKKENDSQKPSSTLQGTQPSENNYEVKRKSPQYLKNGTVGEEYLDKFFIREGNEKIECDFEILDKVGKKLNEIDGLKLNKETNEITGVPEKADEYEIVARYKTSDTQTGFDKCTFKLIINPDPRSLWKVIEPPEEEGDRKSHEVSNFITAGNKKLIAASKRGRSHAHIGKFRDDGFKIMFVESGWSIIAVADGAGCAELSRVGSELACNTAVEVIKQKLESLDIKDFNDKLENYKEHEKTIRLSLYDIIGGAVFEAKKVIYEEANKRKNIKESKKRPEDAFSTTLLLAIHRKFDAGNFVAGFWVGDGGLAIYKEGKEVRLLGAPDSGEFGGQTKFLTTPQVLNSGESINERIKIVLVNDFTALFLMSDGVTDPKFETDSKLSNREYWDALWRELVDPNQANILSDENPDKKLLDWLDFWSPGNHDDRTIAILF